jgi:magnesium chelatase family protein
MSVLSAAIVGIEAVLVTVETDIAFGLGAFNVVGLPDASVKESRDRIRAAVRHAGLTFPRTRVTVNMAPADIRKQGPTYDLPIAISLLVASGEIPLSAVKDTVFLGELALDGTLRSVPGVLSVALACAKSGKQRIIVPKQNAGEAASVRGLRAFGAGSLREVLDHLSGVQPLEAAAPPTAKPPAFHAEIDLRHVRGQETAKRGLEVAASGGHNVLLKGPPGTGKTLLARAIPSILPLLSDEEALEVTAIASVAGTLPHGQGLIRTRPFRTPHHSASAVSLIGGGSTPRPGEVTLAHRGVLFLDELPEFARHVLEHLRQPLEDGQVTIARAAATMRFPSRFLLVAAMNPCPCGFASDPKRSCTCTSRMRSLYDKKLSGPLLDRFDLFIEVPNLDVRELLEDASPEPSERIRKRVEAARERQRHRFLETPFVTNAEIPPSKIDAWCAPTPDGKKLLETAVTDKHLSARGLSRVRKVARTIADLDDSGPIEARHIAEALQYRPG